MENRRHYISLLVIFLIWVCALQLVKSSCKTKRSCKRKFSKAELLNRLSAEAYRVTQLKGTERAFSGSLYNNKRDGKYNCGVCEKDLFSSTDKIDAKNGYPTFSKALPDAVELTREMIAGRLEEEASCKDCGAHVGKYKNRAYVTNEVALGFKAIQKAVKKAVKKALKKAFFAPKKAAKRRRRIFAPKKAAKLRRRIFAAKRRP